jgi:hypothetical protein
MSHCKIHQFHHPGCHDCREASLTHTNALLDDDQPSAASTLLVSALEDVPTFDTSTPAFNDSTPDPPSSDSPFDGGDSGGGGASGDF